MPDASTVVIFDDFGSPAEVEAVRAEIVRIQPAFQFDDRNPDYVKYRIPLDALFAERRAESAVLGAVDRNLFAPRIVEGAQQALLDFTTRSLPYTTTHLTAVTAHVPDGPCGWHMNDMSHHLPRILFTLNFIWYLDLGGRFTGGRLLVSHDNIPQKERGGWAPASPPRVHEVIEPRHNRLVLLPTTFWHMVEPIAVEDWRGPLDGRVSVNGHIGFRLA